VSSKGVIELINLHNTYNRRPSELFFIEDEYTAYCLDEAVAYIIMKIKDGETPTFKVKYDSFKDLYRNYM
jgi:hypothetical protein